MFSEEPAPKSTGGTNRVWYVAIVDDDEDVHQATKFAMLDVVILGRRIEFLHAYSNQEARELFSRHSDIAVVLLDVVMETERAGLELVGYIRETLKWCDTRIILRTGQPGYAPEEDAIRDYDINDYKTKSELTRKKLLTTLTASIRSYDLIRTIDANRRGLHQIITSGASFAVEDGIQTFASGVVTQLAALCGVPSEGLICAQADSMNEAGVAEQFSIVASAGQYSGLMNASIDELRDDRIREAFKKVLTNRTSVIEDHFMTLYFSGHGNRPMAAFVDLPHTLSEVDHQLLEVFCQNFGVCLDNLSLVTQLKSHAYRDQFLLLPNRLKFISEIDAVIEKGERNKVVVLVDIDDFAETNDVLGHIYGDLLLKAVAERLQGHYGSNVFLARISGDVFGLLGPTNVLTPENIRRLFVEPFEIESTAHTVIVSMGVVMLDGFEANGADVLKDASIALKRTKVHQRGYHTVFTREMGLQIRERAKMMQHLHKAFDTQRLFLAYQPQVDLVTRKVIGIEVLVRWKNDDGTLIPPMDFIPLAEHSGLIVTLGAWILRTACFTMRKLKQMNIAPERIAVNVSIMQFRQSDFIKVVQEALQESGLSPHDLELEITESMTMSGTTSILETLAALKHLGIQIAIDDFGTGFSSLSYLERLPIDRLKIDRAFVNQIDTPEGPRIAELITQLGKKLGLKVIAEGIESSTHWDALVGIDCTEGQGYYIARPMGEDQLITWIGDWNSRTS
ncbi:MAG: EAL domain-containing protein, partial [Burkholderiaceae bacterium]|nr:EAL domain-containing protein [Burkholderiaceae bacterium]